jgi:hypothetical protein
MFKRNKTIETIWNLIGGFIISILLANSVFAGNSATFSTSCYMPSYVTTADGKIVLAETQLNQPAAEPEQPTIQEPAVEETVQFTEKQEERITEDDQVAMVNTICAK